MAQDIQKLGESLLSYKEYLNDQLKVQTMNQELNHPVRTIGEHANLEHRRQSALPVMTKYSLIDTQGVLGCCAGVVPLSLVRSHHLVA